MRYFYLTILVLAFKSHQAKSNVNTHIQQGLGRHAFRRINEDPIDSIKEIPDDINEDFNDGKWDQEVKSQGEENNIQRNSASSKITESFYKKTEKDNALVPLQRNIRRNRHYGREIFIKEESVSSDMDLPHWKDEWNEMWMEKKFEALNSTMPRGDVVNMLAARPMGRSCGDPSQQDTPWGSCMGPQDCDAEFRIYRGDHYCGRSTYVCCALVANKYDVYGGVDISFIGTSFETDSNEAAINAKTGASKEIAHKERKRESNKRKIDRNKRKKKIIKTIQKLVTQINQILNAAYRNGTLQKKTRTKDLKQFIAKLKKKFRKDRNAVIDIHHNDVKKMDENLQGTLNKVKSVNSKFMTNDTFRQLVVNGTLNKPLFMAILRSSPDMLSDIQNEMRKDGIDPTKEGINNIHVRAVNETPIQSLNKTRRSGSTIDVELDQLELDTGSDTSGHVDYDSEYDAEYGWLYY